MKQEQKQTVVRRKRVYSFYRGKSTPAVPNIFGRHFRTEHRGGKWLMDICMNSLRFYMKIGYSLSQIPEKFEKMGSMPEAHQIYNDDTMNVRGHAEVFIIGLFCWESCLFCRGKDVKT